MTIAEKARAKSEVLNEFPPSKDLPSSNEAEPSNADPIGHPVSGRDRHPQITQRDLEPRRVPEKNSAAVHDGVTKFRSGLATEVFDQRQ
jgi:hypothetical protein